MRTDTPSWARLAPPKYTEAEWQGVRIERFKAPSFLRGYFSRGFVKPATGWRLMIDGKLWMSNTPMECESNALHVHTAWGHVVVAGLGMGLALRALSDKPDVHRVHVLEISREVIRAFEEATDWRRLWPNASKITITPADALTWQPGRLDDPINFLYADIWPQLGANRMIPDLRRMCRNMKPSAVGAWGQEIVIADELVKRGVTAQTVTRDHMLQLSRSHRIPFEAPLSVEGYSEHLFVACSNALSY